MEAEHAKIGPLLAAVDDAFAEPDQAAAAIGTLPPPVRLIYRTIWKPRYQRTPRW